MTMLGPIFAHDPNVTAFATRRGSVTYGQFCQDIDSMAHWLRDQGIEPGSRLGIRTPTGHSYWNWVIHLAAIRAGAQHATINSNATVKSAIACGIDRCVVIGDNLPDGEGKMQILAMAPTGLTPLATQLEIEPRRWENSAFEHESARLVFTSGTTGKPKSVLWSADIMADRIETAAQDLDVATNPTLLAAIGLMTTAGFRYPIAVWRAGGCVLGWRRQSGSSNAAREAVEKSSLLVTSPANMQALLSGFRGPWPGRETRRVILLGGRVPGGLRDAALRRACSTVTVGYGSTETGRVAAGDARVVDRHPGAVGHLVEGAVVEIVDQKDRPLGPGKAGALRIRTKSMCERYELCEPEDQFSKGSTHGSGFKEGWFYPGDQGILFEDGLLAIDGRASDILNLGGVKISLPDIEQSISQIQGIEDLCAVPISLDRVDALALVMVLADGSDPEVIRREVRHALPTGCPFRLIVIDRLPRNAMDKIDRQTMARRLSSLVQQRETEARGGRRRRGRASP